MNFKDLEGKIISAHESGITLDEAERLASEFLGAQIELAESLRTQDLDARMKKSGLKAIKSAVRMNEVKKHDKKPTESQLDDVVNTDKIVQDEQRGLDEAEVDTEYLQNLFSICKEAHVHFRGIAKGRFDG